jgi:hypothetical protein
MLKRRSFLHAAALCSVPVVGLRLCMVVLTTRMMWCIMIAPQERPFILLMPLQVLRTLAAHRSPANERATDWTCSRDSSPLVPPVLVHVLARTHSHPHPHPHHHIVGFGIDDIPSGVALGAPMIITTPTPTPAPAAAVAVVVASGVRCLSPPVTRRSSHRFRFRLRRLQC